MSACLEMSSKRNVTKILRNTLLNDTRKLVIVQGNVRKETTVANWLQSNWTDGIARYILTRLLHGDVVNMGGSGQPLTVIWIEGVEVGHA